MSDYDWIRIPPMYHEHLEKDPHVFNPGDIITIDVICIDVNAISVHLRERPVTRVGIVLSVEPDTFHNMHAIAPQQICCVLVGKQKYDYIKSVLLRHAQ